MGLKFLNSELQKLCHELQETNASVINSVTDTCIFQVNISFQGFFQTFPYL